MDNYELDNGEIIYPLMKVSVNGKNYLFYTNKQDNVTEEDIFVGEETADDIIAVSDDILPILEAKFEEVFKSIKK